MRSPTNTRASQSAGAPSRPASSPTGRVRHKGKGAPSDADQAPQDDSASRAGVFGAPLLAPSDIETDAERGADSIETLPELEREFGIADWIDPQTGEPAEGQSPPHLEEE